MTYEVQTYTICEGWINCGTVDDKPQTFETWAAAQAELDEFFDDIAAEIASGDRAPDEDYDPEDYRIVETSSHA